MTFYLLAFSIILAFSPFKLFFIKVPLWCLSTLIAVICGYIEAVIDAKGVVALLLYAALLFASLAENSTLLRRVAVCLFGIFSLALALHLVPGFRNHPVVVNQVITPDALPFSLYANFDKGLAGLFLIGYFFNGQANLDYFQTLLRPKATLIIFLLTPCVVLGLAVLLGLVHFNPKIPNFWLSFMAINLFFTCVAEEAFFRGFLQRALSTWLRSTGKSYWLISPILSALLFGIAHIAGGLIYMIVASVAGFGYAYLYHRTHKIEWSILCHFLLNVLHLFLFTYPMLA